jgi:hypothetical protein
MLKAIIQKGAIVPLEPLPPEWRDGFEVSVGPRAGNGAVEPTLQQIDQVYAELDWMCATGDAVDFEKLQAALEEVARHDKATARHLSLARMRPSEIDRISPMGRA